jgi:hypothetical protein
LSATTILPPECFVRPFFGETRSPIVPTALLAPVTAAAGTLHCGDIAYDGVRAARYRVAFFT